MPKKGYKQTEIHKIKRKESFKRFLELNPGYFCGENNSHYKGDLALTKKIYYCTELNCNNRICYRTFKYGKKRCKSCSKLNERNPSYINGKNKNGYPKIFNRRLKNKIHVIYNNTCQFCDSMDDICVHHIDYNKENCKESNLITLCRKCNIKVNQNRSTWKEFFIYWKYINKFYNNYILN